MGGRFGAPCAEVVRLLEAADRLGRAVMGLAGPHALRAFLAEFRAYALRYAYRHALVEQGASARDHGPAAERAAERTVEIAYAAVRGHGFEGDGSVHAVRALRAVVSGFVSLELAAGYQLPTLIDDSFEFVVDLLVGGLDAKARAEKTSREKQPGKAARKSSRTA